MLARKLQKSFHINVLETLVPVWFLQDNGPYVRGQRGVIWMDSAVAIAALNSGKSKNKVLAWYAREFKLLCLKYSVQICFAHIPTLQNLEADWISRGALGTRISDWTVTPLFMRTLNFSIGGAFHVDAFSDPAGVNSQAQQYCSFSSSASSFHFESHHIAWGFPPPALAHNTLTAALTWTCDQVYLLVPQAILQQHAQIRSCTVNKTLCSSQQHEGFLSV